MFEFFGGMGELAVGRFGEEFFGGCKCVFSVMRLVMRVIQAK